MRSFKSGRYEDLEIGSPQRTAEFMDLQPLSAIGLAEDCDAGLSPPSSAVSISEKPAKKPTRQWAAWTRQEEENFFSALRQVGKNFEKITCRVQSKNKDQVRHYYYRLVRRMNKLLGPGFGLDAKNSKDTIAAMLRWWSLLEKYSCTASKLHLKPRRFKTFVEALAHQLLKDRNKSRKKRLPHGENFSSIPETTASVLHSGHSNESLPVTAFLINGQITQKVGSTKGGSLKGLAANDIYSRGGSFTGKIMKPRRRTSLVASAAYKRWEKAAMAGVSLVADAAEQLEQSNNAVNNTFDHLTSDTHSHKHYSSKSIETVTFSGSAKQSTYNNLSEICSHQIRDSNPLTKLKLQLFPVDECTRKALEKDEHNPYLELTLSSRKRISSILEHLYRKWGNSSIASGELTLFPYIIHPDLAHCLRWTQNDISASAGDIYLTIGSPAIFRLRYGWLANGVPASEILQLPTSVHVNDGMLFKDSVEEMSIRNSSHGKVLTDEPCPQELLPSVAETVSVVSGYVHEPMAVNISNKAESMLKESWQHAHTEEYDIKKRHDGLEDLPLDCVTTQADEWANDITNVSVGDLLSETSKAAASFCISPVDGPIDPSLQQVPFSCDSFDAVIAAHVSGHKEQENTSNQTLTSILDAEETCDGFSFHIIPSGERVDSSDRISSGASRHKYRADVVGFHGFLKSTEIEPSDHFTSEREAKPEPREGCNFDNSDLEKTLGLTDIYWPDSLGALDLEIPPSRYVADDVFFGESISIGLSRLMASSLDAFQNCSFFSFSLDKRESSK